VAKNTPDPATKQHETRPAVWESKPWRKFERVVAAVHKFRDQGAEVKWDEKIAGRQVDVSVRFERGGYRYLLLIECKNYKDAVPVKEVEAFVTKSRRLGANKAIIVAANGFQKGAEDEARYHGIELYTLKETRGTWPTEFITTKEPGVQVYGIVLWPADRPAPLILPNRLDVLGELRFDVEGWPPGMALGEIARHNRKMKLEDLAEGRSFSLAFSQGCRVRARSLVKFAGTDSLAIRGIHYTARRVLIPVRASVRPPDVPLRSYVYENVLTGAREVFGMDLPIGLDNTFKPGTFYCNILDISYKCEKVDGDTAQVFVFIDQHGRQFGARVRMKTKDSPMYVEITAEDDIASLEAEYQLWMKADTPGGDQPQDPSKVA